MNPLALFFASGDSLYPGAMLLLIAVATSASSRLLIVWLRRTTTWVGIAFVIMACPPFAWGIDVLFGGVFLAWLTFGVRGQGTGQSRMPRLTITAIFISMLLALSTVELFHRRLPRIRGDASDHLVVIGDSISAGMGNRVRPWPEVMHEMTTVAITNAARAGAVMKDGLAMAESVTPDDHLVLLELGGNDLISGEGSNDFERSLDAVLAKLASPRRTVVMFELPLLPHMVAYGRIQRRLAGKYGVWLIPKHCIAWVLSGNDATSDGLHLTDVGARRMATLVKEVLAPVLRSERVPTIPARRP